MSFNANLPIGLFFGSDTGNTDDVAQQLIAEFGQRYQIHSYDLRESPIQAMQEYSQLIFGIPTWYDGELQSDWERLLIEYAELDLSGKTIALYGLGDQYGYADYFVDGIGIIGRLAEQQGAKVIGFWPVAGYDFDQSLGLTADESQFYGLVLDFENQNELTPERISTWVNAIKE